MARLRRRTRRLIARVAFHTFFALPFVFIVWVAPNCRWEDRTSTVVSKREETTCDVEYGCIDAYWLNMKNGDSVQVDYGAYQGAQPGGAFSYRRNRCW